MHVARCLLIAFLFAAAVLTLGCGRATPEAMTATPVPATQPAEPTATPEPTEVVPTEEPTSTPLPEPTEPAPTETPEPSLTPTAEPEEPTSTPLPEPTEPAPTETPEPSLTPTATPEPTSEPTQPEGQVLLEERCTECHTLARVESAQKTRQEWMTTVERMVNRGARLSDAEFEVLVDYLVETYGP